jgi:hypothetical protein
MARLVELQRAQDCRDLAISAPTGSSFDFYRCLILRQGALSIVCFLLLDQKDIRKDAFSRAY